MQIQSSRKEYFLREKVQVQQSKKSESKEHINRKEKSESKEHSDCEEKSESEEKTVKTDRLTAFLETVKKAKKRQASPKKVSKNVKVRKVTKVAGPDVVDLTSDEGQAIVLKEIDVNKTNKTQSSTKKHVVLKNRVRQVNKVVSSESKELDTDMGDDELGDEEIKDEECYKQEQYAKIE